MIWLHFRIEFVSNVGIRVRDSIIISEAKFCRRHETQNSSVWLDELQCILFMYA